MTDLVVCNHRGPGATAPGPHLFHGRLREAVGEGGGERLDLAGPAGALPTRQLHPVFYMKSQMDAAAQTIEGHDTLVATIRQALLEMGVG